MQLRGHFFPNPLAQSLEQPQIEFTPLTQTLGIMSGMLDIQ